MDFSKLSWLKRFWWLWLVIYFLALAFSLGGYGIGIFILSMFVLFFLLIIWWVIGSSFFSKEYSLGRIFLSLFFLLVLSLFIGLNAPEGGDLTFTKISFFVVSSLALSIKGSVFKNIRSEGEKLKSMPYNKEDSHRFFLLVFFSVVFSAVLIGGVEGFSIVSISYAISPALYKSVVNMAAIVLLAIVGESLFNAFDAWAEARKPGGVERSSARTLRTLANAAVWLLHLYAWSLIA